MKVLNFQERVDFVNKVVDICTIEGEFRPALFDVAYRMMVLEYFADVRFDPEQQDEWPIIVFEDWGRYNYEMRGLEEQLSGLREACLEEVKLASTRNQTAILMSREGWIDELVNSVSDYLEKAAAQLEDFDPKALAKTVKQLNKIDKDLMAVNAAKAKAEVEEFEKENAPAKEPTQPAVKKGRKKKEPVQLKLDDEGNVTAD